MSYGEAYPERCLGFLLRGIYLGTPDEFNQLMYGMKDTIPEYWEEMVEHIPSSERGDLVKAAHTRLMDPHPKIHMKTARAFIKYHIAAATIAPNQIMIDSILNDDQLSLGAARTFIHYAINDFFFEENQVFKNINKINHLPAYIVHGRHDTITRANKAYQLHKSWLDQNYIFLKVLVTQR
ncbi:MAG: hypothetical protein HOL58_07245 [Francisellaceae bacterium]|nr:hypothetical protein [Francisellaceae bacterium]